MQFTQAGYASGSMYFVN